MTALMFSLLFVLSGFCVGVAVAFLYKEISKLAAILLLIIWLASFVYSLNFLIQMVTFW